MRSTNHYTTRAELQSSECGVREVRRPSARLGESPTQTPNNSLRLPPTLGPTNEYENLEPLDERSLIPVAHESNLTAPSRRPRELASLTSENGGTQLPKSSSKASCDGVYENITMGYYAVRTKKMDNLLLKNPPTSYYVDTKLKDAPTFANLTDLVRYYVTYVYLKPNSDGTIETECFEPPNPMNKRSQKDDFTSILFVDAKISIATKSTVLKDKLPPDYSRFLHPDEIPNQILSIDNSKLKTKIQIKSMVLKSTTPSSTTTEIPSKSAFFVQKYGHQMRRPPQVVMPLISLMPPFIALPSEATIHGALTLGSNYPISGFQNLDVSEQNEMRIQMFVLRLFATANLQTSTCQFAARGICEMIRMIFVFANESYIDERITKKQWLRIKDQTFFGKLPILEVDGKKIGQCYSITRYLSRKFGLIGTDEWDQAKDQLRRDIFLPAVDKYFPVYVRLLGEQKSGYFGKSVSWIDFAVSEFLFTINQHEPYILKKYPLLISYMERVRQLPQLVSYLRNRALTPLAV
ncbi:Glutathione S-transferase-1 [Aphelenchoides besseyi]|nr:Glutathione S-transferase-1 [Aphelenchoides besseyi]